MIALEDIFEIEYRGIITKVETIKLPTQILFKANLINKQPLVLCRATDFNHAKFWTSVPEGRQKEAEEIGPLIEQYFRSKAI